MPDAATLQASLDAAVAPTPFRTDVFGDFLADVEAARRAAPLTLRDLDGTPLAASVGGLLLERPGHATALVSLSGLVDPAAVERATRQHGAQLLDLKQASESLVGEYRERVLWALALAALLLAATVWLALRSPRRVLRVLLPMALTTLLVIAVLRGCGIELTLFHLVALILAAGLGLDYALFFEHAGDDREEQLRTLHGVIVCSLMTLLVFSLLALSSIPVLRAIGSTVALGVVCNFVLGLLIARHPARRAARHAMAASHERRRPCSIATGSRRWSRTPARCACGTKCSPGTTRRSACARTTTATRRIRCAATACCARCTCANTARRRWRCMAACWRDRAAARRRPACWSRCAASTCTSRGSTTCPARSNARPRPSCAATMRQQYAFRISHAGTLLAAGRAAVMLQPVVGALQPSGWPRQAKRAQLKPLRQCDTERGHGRWLNHATAAPSSPAAAATSAARSAGNSRPTACT